MTIHKEGYSIIIITLVILLALNYLLFLMLGNFPLVLTLLKIASLVFFLLVLNFFRSPMRKVTLNDKHVIAPADGKVVVIEETTETEVLKDRRIQVSIFMSPLNVHINRYPIGGKVSFFKYHPGLFLVAWHPKSSTENERTTMVIDNDKGVRLLVRQIAGAVARRIVFYAKEGQPAKQGEEFGFIKFGSRVDVFLPLDAKIKVNLNQKTVGGETVIAELA